MAPHQKHGIFVGSQELSASLRDVNGIREWKAGLSIARRNLRNGLKMKRLYEEAHSTGPYDLASSNCHHAALRVFNCCCAKEEDREARPPNELLASTASLLQLNRIFDSSHHDSECGASRSEMASDCNFGNTATAFTEVADLRTNYFARCAAEIRHAAYDSDFGRPEVASTVCIHNKLARPVLVFDCGTQRRHQVEPDQRWGMELSGERANIEIYGVAWMPRSSLCGKVMSMSWPKTSEVKL